MRRETMPSPAGLDAQMRAQARRFRFVVEMA
jgi:hypothetical protein